MAYRAREGIDPDAVRLAVVVQQMVEAEAAGVMFTANPANGRRDQIGDQCRVGPGRVRGQRNGHHGRRRRRSRDGPCAVAPDS